MNRITILLSLCLIGAGCTASVAEDGHPDDFAIDVDDPAGKEDGVIRPVGTFNIEGSVTHGFTQLTLLSDRTFHYVHVTQSKCPSGVRCVVGDRISTDEGSGTYRFTKSGSSRYIRLTDPSQLPIRFRYSYNASTEHLHLSEIVEDGPDNIIDMDRDAHGGWCEATEQCALQELPLFRCLGAHWECNEESECVPSVCGSAN